MCANTKIIENLKGSMSIATTLLIYGSGALPKTFFVHATTQYSEFCILLRRYEYNLRHDVNVNFGAENDSLCLRSSSVQINQEI